MGNCTSVSSSQTKFMQTTKVIFFDGVMKEFREAIKAGEIIEQNPGFFLCHWNSLHIGKFMVSVNSKEELQLGELYFSLPLCKLGYVLSSSDMAEMVFKANSAIKKIRSSRERDNMYCKILPLEKDECDEERWKMDQRIRLETILEETFS